MNNSVYEKTIGNERKYREIKLITAEGNRNYLMSELNYHPTKFFTKCLLAIGMRKAQTLMNKHIQVYLGLSELDLSKTLMYEFRYGYVKEKFSENVKLCFVDTDSFIVHIETVDIYKDVPKNVEIIFDTLNYELDRSIHKK